MASPTEAEQHRASIEDVVTLAVAQLLAEWPELPVDDPLALPGPLADLLADLTADFAQMASTLAAEFYEELRDIAGAAGSYTALPADAPDAATIRTSADWASSAAWVDAEKALRDTATSLDRMIADADRDTVDLNVARDPAQPRFARYASATACAFCALNATRGPVFRSEETAATKYHNHCRCIAVPVWNSDDYQEAPYVADWRAAYLAAADAQGGASDPKAILAHMRAHAGLR